MALKFVLCDFDGVIRHFPAQRDGAIEKSLGIEQGLLARTAFNQELLIPVITGKISDANWRTQIRNRLALSVGVEKAGQALARWSESPGEVDRALLKEMMEATSGLKVCLLTNATDRLPRDLGLLGLSTAFHKVFNSSELGCAKPDYAVFSMVLQALNCSAKEAVFIDDSAKNTAAADRIGIVSHHFTGRKGLLDFFASL